MQRVLVLKDTGTKNLFAIVTEDGGVLNFRGVTDAGVQWAEWVEAQGEPVTSLEKVLPLADYGLSLEGPKALSPAMEASLAEYLKPAPVEEKTSGRTPEQWRAAMNYKALSHQRDMRLAALAYEVKRTRAVRVPDLGNGRPGYRCPPGTRYGGRITDRFGRNCGWGVARRLTNAIGDTARQVEDTLEGRRKRRLARRVARAEERARNAKPSTGRRRSRVGPEQLTLFDAPGKPKRRRRGTSPQKPKISERLDRFADRVDGGYGRRGRRNRRSRRGSEPQKPKISERLDRFADRVDGGYGKRRREERRKRRAERRANRKPISQRLEEFADRVDGGYGRRRDRRRRRAGKKPLSQRLDDFADRVDGGYGKKPVRRRRNGGVTETAKKPKKPSKDLDFEPKTQFEKKLREMDDDEIIDRLRNPADNRPTDGTFGYNPQIDKRINDAVKREARRRGLTANSKKTGKKKPEADADAPSAPAAKKPAAKKPSGPANKKKPGKQYGGTFSKEENAKASAITAATNNGKPMYVVRTENGKFKVVDEERFAAGDEDAVFAVGPNGDIIDLPGTAADVDDVIEDVADTIEEIKKDEEQDLKDLKVAAGVTELQRSKTGQFLPDDLADVLSDEQRAAFLEAWRGQQDEVREFWGSRFGDDNPFEADGDLDLEKVLEKIDGIIADEQGKDAPNEGKLGVYRTERTNFLAMFAPDAGKDEVDPLERFNLVQPKRRQAVIDDANLEELVVSGKKVKPKKVKTTVTGEEADVPEADTPETPEVEAPEAEAPEAEAPEIETAEPFDPMYMNSADAAFKSIAAAEKMAEDMPVEDLDAAVSNLIKDLDGKPKVNVTAYAKQVKDLDAELNAIGADDPDWKEKTIDVLARKRFLHDYVLPGVNESIAEQLDDIAQQDKALLDEKIANAKNHVDKRREALKEVGLTSTSLDVQMLNAYPTIGGPPVPTEEAVASRMAQAIKEIDADEKKAIERVEALTAKGMLPNDSEIKAAYIYPDLRRKLAEESRDRDLEKIKNAEAEQVDTPDVETPNVPTLDETAPDAPGPTATGSGVGAVMDTPDFDFAKLRDYEYEKLNNATTMDALIVRSNKHGGRYDEIIDKLPANFDSLSADDQRAALRTAAGVADDLTVAKQLGRSSVISQIGDPDSLEVLNGNLRYMNPDAEIPQGMLDMGFLTDPDNTVVASSLKSAKQRLAEAEAAYDALPSGVSPIESFRALGRVNSARNQYVAYSIQNYARQLRVGSADDQVQAATEMSNAIDGLHPTVKGKVVDAAVSGFSVKTGTVNNLLPKSVAKTDFDSTTLGTVQPTGKAIAYAVPLGSGNIWNIDNANTHLAEGGALSTVPDILLKEAIWNNSGPNGRFQIIDDGSIVGGFNDHGQSLMDKTTGFVDTVTGKKYVIKTAHRNEQEHTQEMAAARMAQILGLPTPGIRLGSGVIEKPLPSHRAEQEGKANGIQRSIVMEHVENLFGEGYDVIGPISKLSSTDEIDGDSLARLMVLDRSMNYFDRTQTNLIAVRRPDGLVHLHPIDHGNAFYAFDKGVDKEQAAGFTAVTKGDNINLAALANNLSPEQKERFANAMTDSVKRLKRTKWDTEFAEIGNVQKLTDPEKSRLDRHGNWMNDRLESLDFDAMTDSALGQLGFSKEQIDEFRAGEAKNFALPETETLASVAPTLSDDLPTVNLGKALLYDGGKIEGFKVVAQPIKVRGFKNEAGNATKAKDGTQIHFKLLDEDVKELVKGEGWTQFAGKALGVTGKGSMASINIDPAGNNTYFPGGASNTYVKQLDDSTWVFVTHNPFGNQTADSNIARIVMLGKPEDTLVDSARIAKAMETVNVTQHGQPTAEQVRSVGMRRMGNTIIGRDQVANLTDEQIEQRLADAGYSPDDLIMGKDADGSPSVRLSLEATRRLMQQMGNVEDIYHYYMYKVSEDKYEARVVDIMSSNALASTVQRYNNGVNVEGWSSKDDMYKGSADQIFTKVGNSSSENGYRMSDSGPYGPRAWTWYGIPEMTLSRLDTYTTETDKYGDFAYRVPHASVKGKSSAELMINGTGRISTGITVLPDQVTVDRVIEKLSERGVTEIDGIPVNALVSTRQDALEKREALRALWEQRNWHEG